MVHTREAEYTQLQTRRGSRPTAGADEAAEVAIFRPFFLAGMLSVLTSGCLLGAVALFGISQRASYIATGWTPYILAHANSQLFGWVGLFVMGFALQQHPPRKSRVALYHRLAYASLGLIVASIVLRFLAEPRMAVNPDVWMPVGIASAFMQVAAVLLFIANTGMTRARTVDPTTGRRAGLPWQSLFVFASLGWWLLAAAAEPIVFALSHQAGDEGRLASILFVAKWFVPYREAQFLGFVVNMIFGVALARFSTDFGIRAADRGLGLTGFALWNAGLLARSYGWLSYFQAEMGPGTGVIYFLSGGMLATAAVCLVLALRIFEPLPAGSARPVSITFTRAAFAWLLLSGVLLVLEPFHLKAIGAPFSHAYTGAIRHALTVGFISQMIVGVSSYIVPWLRGGPQMTAARAGTILLLLNGGNALRVGCELLTDYTRAAFPLMGVTGFVELVALLLWALYVGGLIVTRRSSPVDDNRYRTNREDQI